MIALLRREIRQLRAHHLPYIKHQIDHYYVAEISNFALNHLINAGIENLIRYDGK